jgi:hypothetical protein
MDEFYQPKRPFVFCSFLDKSIRPNMILIFGSMVNAVFITKHNHETKNKVNEILFSILSILNDIEVKLRKRFKMPEDQESQNAKRYRTEFIVIIALMMIVAVFIFAQVLPRW